MNINLAKKFKNLQNLLLYERIKNLKYNLYKFAEKVVKLHTKSWLAIDNLF